MGTFYSLSQGLYSTISSCQRDGRYATMHEILLHNKKNHPAQLLIWAKSNTIHISSILAQNDIEKFYKKVNWNSNNLGKGCCGAENLNIIKYVCVIDKLFILCILLPQYVMIYTVILGLSQ